MGMMKAGTTSIYGYFRCGLDAKYHSRLSHYDCHPPPEGSFLREKKQYTGMACGKRMRRNIQKYQRGAFDEMREFDLYAELDAIEGNGGLTLPQWSFVADIHAAFPHATWVLNVREPAGWVRSLDRWKDLRQRHVDYPGGEEFPAGRGARDEEMVEFYRRQAQRVRDFVADHPSHALVEVAIDSPTAGRVMEEAFGISEACWGARNVYNGTAKWAA